MTGGDIHGLDTGSSPKGHAHHLTVEGERGEITSGRAHVSVLADEARLRTADGRCVEKEAGVAREAEAARVSETLTVKEDRVGPRPEAAESSEERGQLPEGEEAWDVREACTGDGLSRLDDLEGGQGDDDDGRVHAVRGTGVRHVGSRNESDSPGQGLEADPRAERFLNGDGFVVGDAPRMQGLCFHTAMIRQRGSDPRRRARRGPWRALIPVSFNGRSGASSSKDPLEWDNPRAMRRRDIEAFARAQRLTREVVLEAAQALRPSDREWDVARRIDEGLCRLGVRHWLHTPYAWWGERTRFASFAHWQPDALPTDRALQEGEAFILDAAPLLDGTPADFAFSGVLGGESDAAEVHGRLCQALAELKEAIVAWVRSPCDGAALFDRVGEEIARRGLEAIHPLYPGRVLGHSVNEFPSLFGRAPRIGDGFQLPLVATAAWALLKHRFTGAPYPFINDFKAQRLQGLFAVEPHVAEAGVGVKFESILLVDGDESRWLDPGLFGEVEG